MYRLGNQKPIKGVVVMEGQAVQAFNRGGFNAKELETGRGHLVSNDLWPGLMQRQLAELRFDLQFPGISNTHKDFIRAVFQGIPYFGGKPFRFSSPPH